MTDSTAVARLAWRGPVLGALTAALAVLVWVGIAGGGESEGGALTYAGCITSSSDVSSCTGIPGATPGGSTTGLNDLRSVVVSPEGASVYTASVGGDAVY